MVEAFLKLPGINFRIEDPHGKTAMYYYAEDNKDMIELLSRVCGKESLGLKPSNKSNNPNAASLVEKYCIIS
jgi:hypothetical protein